MKTMNHRLTRLAAAGALLLATGVGAETVTDTTPTTVAPTAWYPVEVIDNQGMARYADAWGLPLELYGNPYRFGAYAAEYGGTGADVQPPGQASGDERTGTARGR